MRSPNAEPYSPSGAGARPSLLYEVRKVLKYESELNPAFALDVAGTAHGQNLFACIQCGTCSGTCPVSHYMDYTPRRIIAMVRKGFEDEVLGSSTIWLCASCYQCAVDCPKQIKLTDIMYALKQKAIARGLYPKKFPIPVMAEEFYKGVAKNGRNSEGTLMINMARRTSLFNLFKYTRLGRKLFTTGRMALKGEGIENKEQLRALLRGVEKAEEEAR
jgi:heterodisulfide reductase subunit C